MCRGCWWNDHGAPMINSPEVLATAELIRRLYAMPGCDMGGPLHAMLDDMNIDDEQVDSDYYDATDGRTIETYLCVHRMAQEGTAWQHVYDDELHPPTEVAELARLILASFRRMPKSHRAAAIAWHEGWIMPEATTLVEAGSAAREASPEQVDALIADLLKPDPPASKACVAIPCPPWTGPGNDEREANLRTRGVPDDQIRPRLLWSELSVNGQPVGPDFDFGSLMGEPAQIGALQPMPPDLFRISEQHARWRDNIPTRLTIRTDGAILIDQTITAPHPPHLSGPAEPGEEEPEEPEEPYTPPCGDPECHQWHCGHCEDHTGMMGHNGTWCAAIGAKRAFHHCCPGDCELTETT